MEEKRARDQGSLAPMAILSQVPPHCSTKQGNPLKSFPAFHYTGSADHQPHLSPAHYILLLSTYSMWVPLAPQSLTFRFKRPLLRNSPEVQLLGLLALTARGLGSILGQGTKILQAAWHSQKNKTRQINLKSHCSRKFSTFQ